MSVPDYARASPAGDHTGAFVADVVAAVSHPAEMLNQRLQFGPASGTRPPQRRVPHTALLPADLDRFRAWFPRWQNARVPNQRLAPRDLRSQVRFAVDPNGEQFTLLEAVEQSPTLPPWISAIAADLDVAWAQLAGMSVQYRALLSDIEEALRLLVPRGWAVFNMDSSQVRQAVALVAEGRGEEADELLADQWEKDTYRTKRVCDRVGSMGAFEPDYGAMFVRRAALLRKAKEHHDHGRYDASVLILQAQMEGLTTDVTANRKFFSRRADVGANVVDTGQLVSIESSLAALQVLYTEGGIETQSTGSLSRHGAAHGRELAYDTRLNSAKTWSVLDALVEWAMPLARQEAERRRADRQAASAGSEDTDEEGRRLDDREFTETKAMLRVLQTSAMGWWRQRGYFRDDLIGGVYATKDFEKRGLSTDHDTRSQVSPDGQQTWFWRKTISGCVLGVGLAAKNRGFLEWLYSGAEPPTAGPLDAPDVWGQVFDTPPDWQV